MGDPTTNNFWGHFGQNLFCIFETFLALSNMHNCKPQFGLQHNNPFDTDKLFLKCDGNVYHCMIHHWKAEVFSIYNGVCEIVIFGMLR